MRSKFAEILAFIYLELTRYRTGNSNSLMHFPALTALIMKDWESLADNVSAVH